MVPVTFRVVLDANVLFPFSLRDTLLRAAAAGYYQVYWSDEILEETTRNLKAKEFLVDLLDLDENGMVELLQRQANALKNPPVTLDELLEGLHKSVPNFAEKLREKLPAG